MAGFEDCINNGEAEGAITPEEARRLRQDYRRRRASYGPMFGEDADRMAARHTFDQLEAEAARRRKLKVLAIRAQQRIAFDMRRFRDDLGREDMKQAGLALLDSTVFQGGVEGANIRYQAIRGRFHAMIPEALEKFRPGITGRKRNVADLDEMTDQLFAGEFRSGPAGEMAQAVRDAMEQARQMFNEAGGAIPKLDRYGVPQAHNELAIIEAGYETWRNFLLPLLDRKRMLSHATGLPMADEELELALKDVFEAIRTDGWSRKEPSAGIGGRALANSRAEHRFLHFRDGASWRAYQSRFGVGDAWSAVLGYLDGMARDIALMQRFGPNPRAGLEYAKQLMRQDAGLSGSALRKRQAKSAIYDMETMFLNMTGSVNAPAHAKTAMVMGTVRNFLVSTQLGSAMLSAITDVNFGRMTAQFNGMPAHRVIARQVSLLNPLNTGDRQLAVRLGLIADEASHILSSQSRYLGEVQGHEVSRRLAEATMRLSGLSAWTQAGRWAFGMEFLGFLADHADTPFQQLPQPLQRTLTRHGLAGDWDRVRSGPVNEANGGRFLDPGSFDDQDLGLRIVSMIRSETEFAVPSVSLYGQSKVGGREAAGTIGGELLRNTLMYKSFGITLAMTHGRRAAMRAGWMGKLTYAGDLIVSATVLGALSMQAKEIAKGRDPREMDSSEFWTAAMMQGGGFGIFGDFVFSDTNRFGGGMAETLAGPVVGLATDAHRATVGNLRQLAEGDSLEDTKAVSDVLGLAERYTPVASSLWYSKLVTQRLIFDQIRRATDPQNAQDRFDRQAATARRDYGTDYWWDPGSAVPERGPEVVPEAP